MIRVVGFQSGSYILTEKRYWITNTGKEGRKEGLNTCNKYPYAPRFPRQDNTMRTKSSEMLCLVVERVVSDVSKNWNVFYLKGHVQARP